MIIFIYNIHKKSICSETLVGWFHNDDGSHWGCFHAKQISNSGQYTPNSKVDPRTYKSEFVVAPPRFRDANMQVQTDEITNQKQESLLEQQQQEQEQEQQQEHHKLQTDKQHINKQQQQQQQQRTPYNYKRVSMSEIANDAL